jgi:hypothetical protein
VSRVAAAVAGLLLSASPAFAQLTAAAPGLPALRLRSDTLRIVLPDAFSGAGRLVPRAAADPAALARAWEEGLRQRLAARAGARWRAALTADSSLLAVPAPAALGGRELVPEAPGGARGVQVLGQYAELGIRMTALLEMRLERLRNLRCTSADAASFSAACRGGFTPPTVEPQLSVRTGGVVAQRVHVNVDYDTQREFDASNNIQLYYQGLEDEILRRVEVGNVTFTPPPSRFLTGGLPANNFGIALSGQVGALDFGTIYAQQKGNVVRNRIFTIGDQSVQPVERLAADRDFEPQRFFFVRDPRRIPGYPAFDVLAFGQAALPDSIRVTQVRLYRHRAAINRPQAETNLGGIQAVARRTDSPQRAGPLAWEILVEGRDYYLDPSGLWFALALRLDPDDLLGVSYVTAAGDTVGTFPATATASRVDTLELIYEPRRGPDVPTFFYEMRNVYRVGAVDDIGRASVAVRLLVGGSERPAAGAPTFLSLLGLAQESDATTFDTYNRLFPRDRDPAAGAPLREYFIVFPTLTPFADATRLPPAYRTDSLYRTPTYLLRAQGPAPLFSLDLRYDARGGDNRGTLLIGGYQIRTGSERLTANGRPLTRNVDYTINYEVGQVTFLNPDSLFPRPTQVAVQFEENQAFAVAPTSVVGAQARYDFGDHGSVSALAILQRQRTTFTRPPLGFEPSSNLVMGVVGSFRFEPERLTRWLDALPLVRTTAASRITLDAELAASRPSPNELGVAYVETFEGEAGQFLSLAEGAWELGSRPASPRGLDVAGVDPVGGLFDQDAVALTWQNLVPAADGRIVQILPQEIDPSIRTQGTGRTAETVLWLAVHADTVGGLVDPVTFRTRWLLAHTPGPRWRSVTQPLSATGVDLTRVEFLEFWVLEDDAGRTRGAGTTLVFDLGSVFEDAVDFVPTAFTRSGARDTTYTGRRRAGAGRLDTERDTLTGTFNAVLDDRGILGDVADSIRDADADTVVRNLPLCTSRLSEGLVVYDWGSLQTRCTRRNGTADSEDLNNDQHLDTLVAAAAEAHVRYVFRVGDPRYFVRSGGTVAGVGQWKLYRVPFRSDTLQVGAPDLRQVRALRLTVVAPESPRPESTLYFALARMRLLGAPWVKRDATPIPGLAGQQGGAHGEVVASVVTTENRDDLGYEPPPGVTDQGSSVGPSIGATQINEKSLRLLGRDVRPGERAEAYFRFPEGNRNFLGYRELRVWARGRGAGWDERELSFFVKVGQNEDNFYLYRSPLSTTTWLPEVVVDFDRWLALRAAIEQRFLSGEPPGGAAACGGDTTAYVACDGPYVVHVRNPSVAPPNLTQVQEIAVGFVRDSGAALDTAELWVDDIRLTGVVNDRGYAGAVNLGVTAADVAELTLAASRRDGDFRQLGETPSYVGSTSLALASTIRLERLGLERLGLVAPVTLRADRTSQDPYFLNGTDVLAGGLQGLRRPDQRSVSWALSLRRSRRGDAWWERALVDRLTVSALWGSGSSRTELSTATSRMSDLRADYSASPGDRSVSALPGFLRGALDRLPSFLRRSELVQGLRTSRLRVTPVTLAFGAGLARTSADRTSYRLPIATAADSAVPVLSSSAVLRSNARIDLRPFASLSLGASATWDRDLKDYGGSTTIGAIAQQSRQRFLGIDVGFLRQQTLTTRLGWTPPLASWVRPRFAWSSDFALSRDPNAGQPERTEGDSAGGYRLPTTWANGMSADLSASLDLSRLLRNLLGDSSGVRDLLDRITSVDVGRRITRRSQYSRAGFDPGLRYRLGLGGFGSFARQGEALASAANDQQNDRATVAMRLPAGLQVAGQYAQTVTENLVRRETRQQLQRTTDTDWPNVTGRLLWAPRRSLAGLLTNVTVTAGYQERSTRTVQPPLEPGASGAGGLRSVQETRSTPASLSLVWARGVTTTVATTNERSRADRTGNPTLGARRSSSADLTFAFRPPQDIVPLRSDVRTSLRYLSARSSTCVQRVGAATCQAVADSRRREVNLTMDTDLPPSVSAGLALGYVLNDDRHVNRKFAQWTLAVSARVYFGAGEVQ